MTESRSRSAEATTIDIPAVPIFVPSTQMTAALADAAYAATQAAEYLRNSKAWIFYEELAAAKDAGSCMLLNIIDNLTLPDLITLMPRLNRPPKKRGAKRGRRPANAAIDAQAFANVFAATGKQPTVSAIAAEKVRLLGKSPEDIENVRRDLSRARNRTK